MKKINDDFNGVNGADHLLSMVGFENLKYTNNVQRIILDARIQHWIIPIIAKYFPLVPHSFQIWRFKRVFEGDKKTNNFCLTCHIKSEYLLAQDILNNEILQFAFTLYNQNIDFDYLKLWIESDTLLLPQEH